MPLFTTTRRAQIGPAAEDLSQPWSGQWSAGAGAEYDPVAAATVKKIKGGDYVHHYKAGDFATLNVGTGGHDVVLYNF